MKKVSLIILAAVALIGTIGCNNINPVGDAGQDAPSLPPAASMTIPEFGSADGLGKSALPETHFASTLAYLAVSYWTTTVQLALLQPAMLFKICHSTQPSPLPDNSGWVWKVSDNNGFSAELTGRVENDQVQWTMSVSGENLSNFVWFTGASVITGRQGSWTFYDTVGGGTPSIRFTYELTDAQNTVNVMVIDENSAGKGSYLQWTERGNDMSFEAYGAEKNEKFLIAWNKISEAGSISNLITGEKYCWDTKQNGHVDIACQ
jgi:hypothetical protein